MSSGGGLSDIPLILQEEKKKRQWCSPGAIVNYINSLILLAAFIACVIVIGTVGSIQGNLKAYVDPDIPDTNTTNQPRHACYMFSSCKGDAIDNISHCYFKPRETNECEGAMVGYSIIALVCFVFFVVSLIYAILNLRISWSAVVEVVTVVILLLFGFSLSVMISVGNLITCKSIKSFYGVKDCAREFPYKEFHYYALAQTAMNSSWAVFLILLVLLIVYIVRLVIFLRRRKKSRELTANITADATKDASTSNIYNKL